MDFLKIAQKYAAAGLHVLPCAPREKFPVISKKDGGNGVWDATTDPSTLVVWAAKYPHANVGIHPGPSGMIVLDFDNKGEDGQYGSHPNGLDTLEELKQFHPEMEEHPWIVSTPTGGYHYWFTAPEDFELNNPVRLMTGLDIRFNGTFVVAPPSVHPNGGKYSWVRKEGDKPPMLPAALAERIIEAKKTSKGSAAAASAEDEDDSPIEARHATLISLGASFRARGLARSTIKAMLMDINQRRCRPDPLPESEIDRIVDANMNLTPTFNAIDEAQRKFAPETVQRGSGVANQPNAGKKKLKLTSYSDIKKEDISWLMPGYIAKGKFTLMFGLEGRGKSYATLGIAAMITQGIPLPGMTELEAASYGPGQVLILTYEDNPEDTIKPRLEKCGADMSKIFTVHYTDGLVTAKDMQALEETIQQLDNLVLIIIDPITSFAGNINESSETDVRSAINPLVQLAFKKKIAVLGIKHANKKEDVSISNRVSGSRAWTALARSVILCGHDNEKENEQFHTYGGMVSTKGNLSGATPGWGYEVDNGVFRFTGADISLCPERLFPKKEKKEGQK